MSIPDHVIDWLPALYTPPLLTEPGTSVYPSGIISSTAIPVASSFVVSASLLNTEIVKVTVSPAFTAVGFTVFVNSRSAFAHICTVT